MDQDNPQYISLDVKYKYITSKTKFSIDVKINHSYIKSIYYISKEIKNKLEFSAPLSNLLLEIVFINVQWKH